MPAMKKFTSLEDNLCSLAFGQSTESESFYSPDCSRVTEVKLPALLAHGKPHSALTLLAASLSFRWMVDGVWGSLEIRNGPYY